MSAEMQDTTAAVLQLASAIMSCRRYPGRASPLGRDTESSTDTHTASLGGEAIAAAAQARR